MSFLPLPLHVHLSQNSLAIATATDLRSRKLLFHTLSDAAASPLAPSEPRPGFGSFDLNVVMVLSVLLCALVCFLGLNAILKLAFRCSNLLASLSSSNTPNFQSPRFVHTGVRRKALKTFPTVEYSSKDAKFPGLDAECVICLSEFEPGDRLRLLPKCHHGFHVQCIDKWLSCHTSCPKCRNCLTETCRKIVGYGEAAATASSSDPPPAPVRAENTMTVNIAPLERETLICNYRESR